MYFLEVIAPVEMYRQVSAGMTARIFPEEPIGGELEAVVKTVDPVVDAASGTFRIRLELDNRDNSIPAGIACAVAGVAFVALIGWRLLPKSTRERQAGKELFDLGSYLVEMRFGPESKSIGKSRYCIGRQPPDGPPS